jgi:hypothetical protein
LYVYYDGDGGAEKLPNVLTSEIVSRTLGGREQGRR